MLFLALTLPPTTLPTCLLRESTFLIILWASEMANMYNHCLLLNCWFSPHIMFFPFLSFFLFFFNQWGLLASADYSEVFTLLVALDFLRSIMKWRMCLLLSFNIIIFQVDTKVFYFNLIFFYRIENVLPISVFPYSFLYHFTLFYPAK